MFERLVEVNRECLPKRKRSAGEGGADRLDAGIKALVRQRKGKPRSPAEPRPPVPRNLDMASEMLGLSDVERAVLQFLITLDRADMQALVDPIPCGGANDPAIIIASAIAQPLHKVEAALRPKERLVGSGLVQLVSHGDLDDRVTADQRLPLMIPVRELERTSFIDEFLPTAPPPSLTPADFSHLADELGIARRLLEAAFQERKPGVSLLLYGPTGTGKSELARVLAKDGVRSLTGAV